MQLTWAFGSTRHRCSPELRIQHVRGYNFSEQVRRSLAAARVVAERLESSQVATEHLLLGLLETERRGVIAEVLERFAVRRRNSDGHSKSARKPARSHVRQRLTCRTPRLPKRCWQKPLLKLENSRIAGSTRITCRSAQSICS